MKYFRNKITTLNDSDENFIQKDLNERVSDTITINIL